MDIFAHAFWTYALFHKKKYKWTATLFGVLPDILSFGFYFLYLVFTGFTFVRNEGAIPGYVFTLYNVTHSFFIFLITVLVIYFILKKFPWLMLGWGLHILIDFPTHTREFFPTPILWPISDFNINGIAWSNKWFMIINYSALVIVYSWIFYKMNKNKKKN